MFIRKVLVLCLFSTLILAASGQQKTLFLEHIYWGEGAFFNSTTTSGPEALPFESPLFLSFSVPALPKSEALLLEYGVQSSILWYLDVPQSFWSGYHLIIKSQVIPEGISVETMFAIDGVRDIVHTHTDYCRTNKTSFKWIIKRGGFLENYVFPPLQITYIATGDYVPDDIANTILNDLFNYGFTVDVTVFGQAVGVQKFYLVSGWIQVTSMTKR
jgi:hypothetical protein